MEEYQVRLDIFEGPMDLLVYLIRQQEIDIYDIPIALLADQYLEYVTRIENLNLEKAGDFLLMAATLLQIKSRMLLPRPEGEEGEWEDPRTELVEKIVEYMQFKEIAEHMRRLEELSSRQAERGFSEVDLYSYQEEGIQIDATVNELILTFGRLLLKKPPPEPVHHLLREKISTVRRAGEIREMLRQARRLIFSDLVPEGSSRSFIVVTLVALLEMAKGREIKIEQTDPFSQLWIVRKRLKSATVNGGDKPEEPPKDQAGTDSAGSVHLD
jgi:segregation and condensation protein A